MAFLLSLVVASIVVVEISHSKVQSSICQKFPPEEFDEENDENEWTKPNNCSIKQLKKHF